MASSWRNNVFDQGLGSAGATLAARVHGPLPLWITNWLISPNLAAMWGIPPADMPDLPYALFGWDHLSTMPFPYGLAVDPDEPA